MHGHVSMDWIPESASRIKRMQVEKRIARGVWIWQNGRSGIPVRSRQRQSGATLIGLAHHRLVQVVDAAVEPESSPGHVDSINAVIHVAGEQNCLGAVGLKSANTSLERQRAMLA